MSTKTLGVSAGGSDYYVRDLMPAVELSNTSSFNVRVTGRVCYVPFQVRHALTADGLIAVHGNVGAGNLYVALYDSDPTVAPQPRNRLAVSASTAVSGTTRRQYVAFTVPIQLQTGIYFGALESDNNTDNYLGLYSHLAQFIGGPVQGINPFYEDLGPYAIPPLGATPLAWVDDDRQLRLYLRVSSIP